MCISLVGRHLSTAASLLQEDSSATIASCPCSHSSTTPFEVPETKQHSPFGVQLFPLLSVRRLFRHSPATLFLCAKSIYLFVHFAAHTILQMTDNRLESSPRCSNNLHRATEMIPRQRRYVRGLRCSSPARSATFELVDIP